jgi:VCBS repeat protein
VGTYWRLFSVVLLFGISLPPHSSSQQRATPPPVQFAPPIMYGYPASYPQAIASGDFNNDGIPDLIVGSEYGDGLIKLGRGDGTFGPWRWGARSNNISVIAVGKFNGENRKLDAVLNDYSDAWVEGNGHRAFLDAGGNSVAGFAVGDFNGDGKLDVAALVESEPTAAYLYLGNGDGTFQPARVFSLEERVPTAILTGDFNGDGKPDLAVLCSEQVAVLLGDGKGGFGSPIRFRFSNKYPYLPYAMTSADFNGNHKLDLAVAYQNSKGGSSFIRILMGNGDGTFRRGALARAGKFEPSIATADFNGDGIPDLVVPGDHCLIDGHHANCISVLLGNGNGTFQPPANFRGAAAQITVADFNGDGKPDVAGVFPSGVSVLINTTPFPALNAKPAANPITLALPYRRPESGEK